MAWVAIAKAWLGMAIGAIFGTIAVGTPLPAASRPDPHVKNYLIRLLPRVDGLRDVRVRARGRRSGLGSCATFITCRKIPNGEMLEGSRKVKRTDYVCGRPLNSGVVCPRTSLGQVKRKITQSHRAHGDFRRYRLCDSAALCEVFLTCPANYEPKIAFSCPTG